MTAEAVERIDRDMKRLSDAMRRLGETLEEPEASSRSWQDAGRAFEDAMGLFWRVVKEMLAACGIEVRMPRQAIDAARERGWLDDPTLWIEMLKDEYELSGGSHSPAAARRVYPRLRGHYEEMDRLRLRLIDGMAELRAG